MNNGMKYGDVALGVEAALPGWNRGRAFTTPAFGEP